MTKFKKIFLLSSTIIASISASAVAIACTPGSSSDDTTTDTDTQNEQLTKISNALIAKVNTNLEKNHADDKPSAIFNINDSTNATDAAKFLNTLGISKSDLTSSDDDKYKLVLSINKISDATSTEKGYVDFKIVKFYDDNNVGEVTFKANIFKYKEEIDANAKDQKSWQALESAWNSSIKISSNTTNASLNTQLASEVTSVTVSDMFKNSFKVLADLISENDGKISSVNVLSSDNSTGSLEIKLSISVGTTLNNKELSVKLFGFKIESKTESNPGTVTPPTTTNPNDGNSNSGNSGSTTNGSGSTTTSPSTGTGSNSGSTTTSPSTGNESNSGSTTTSPSTGTGSNSGSTTTSPSTGNESNSGSNTTSPSTGTGSNSGSATTSPSTGTGSNSGDTTTSPSTGSQTSGSQTETTEKTDEDKMSDFTKLWLSATSNASNVEVVGIASIKKTPGQINSISNLEFSSWFPTLQKLITDNNITLSEISPDSTDSDSNNSQGTLRINLHIKLGSEEDTVSFKATGFWTTSKYTSDAISGLANEFYRFASGKQSSTELSDINPSSVSSESLLDIFENKFSSLYAWVTVEKEGSVNSVRITKADDENGSLTATFSTSIGELSVPLTVTLTGFKITTYNQKQLQTAIEKLTTWTSNNESKLTIKNSSDKEATSITNSEVKDNFSSWFPTLNTALRITDVTFGIEVSNANNISGSIDFKISLSSGTETKTFDHTFTIINLKSSKSGIELYSEALNSNNFIADGKSGILPTNVTLTNWRQILNTSSSLATKVSGLASTVTQSDLRLEPNDENGTILVFVKLTEGETTKIVSFTLTDLLTTAEYNKIIDDENAQFNELVSKLDKQTFEVNSSLKNKHTVYGNSGSLSIRGLEDVRAMSPTLAALLNTYGISQIDDGKTLALKYEGTTRDRTNGTITVKALLTTENSHKSQEVTITLTGFVKG